MVPGVGYGVMAGEKGKERLVSAGKVFNLAVLPATTGCFSGRKPHLSHLLLLSLLLLPLG